MYSNGLSFVRPAIREAARAIIARAAYVLEETAGKRYHEPEIILTYCAAT